MTLKWLEPFLRRLSLMFRRFFLDMRLSYAFSDDETTIEVTVSRVSKSVGVALVPSAIFAITEGSVRFVKLDLDSDIDYAEFETSSFLELRGTILYVVYSLLAAEHPDLKFYDFLSKVLEHKIEHAQDFFEYLLLINEVKFAKDDDHLFVYDYGNFRFFQDAVSFYSTKSVRVVYKINSDFSAFNVALLSFDAANASLNPDSLEDPSKEAKLFAFETFDDGTEKEEAAGADDESMGGDFGGFGDSSGFGGDDSGFGGGGSEHIPVEGGDDDSSGLGSGGLDDQGFEE